MVAFGLGAKCLTALWDLVSGHKTNSVRLSLSNGERVVRKVQPEVPASPVKSL